MFIRYDRFAPILGVCQDIAPGASQENVLAFFDPAVGDAVAHDNFAVERLFAVPGVTQPYIRIAGQS